MSISFNFLFFFYILFCLRKLENEAKILPPQTPPSLMVNKLNQFLLDCAINPQMKEAYDNTRNVFNWSDSTSVCFFKFFLKFKFLEFYQLCL